MRFFSPVTRSRQPLSWLIRMTVLLLVTSLCAIVPAQASPTQSSPRQIGQVKAAGVAGATSTTIAVSVRVRNTTDKRRSAAHAQVFLIGADRVFGLGKVKVPRIRAKGRVTASVKRKAPATAPAGQYAVRVCLVAYPDECRTSGRTVKIASARLTAGPTSVSFADTLEGTSSSAERVRITNTGPTRTRTLDASVGNASSFDLTGSTCRAPLSPGASCTVDVTFAPRAAGSATGTLQVTDGAGTRVTVALTGTGTGTVLDAAALAISQDDHDFGDTEVGSTSGPVDLTVTNRGELPTGVLDVTLSSGTSDDFEITADTCAGVLAPSATCTVAVSFTPTATGELTSSLSVSATPGGSVSTDLSGTGLAPAALSLDRAAVAFGAVLIGDTTDSEALTLTNKGDVASGFPSVTIQGDDADQFKIVANGCIVVVPASGTCDIEVAFAPTASGTASAELAVTGTPGGEVSAALGGVGQAPAELSISESSYDFGYSDAPVEHILTVTNEGDATSGPPVVDLDGSSAFQITSDTCAGALTGGASCAVGVTYTRSGSTEQSAELSVSAAPGGTLTADLTGSPIAVTIDPISYDFGGVAVGTGSGPASFTITNHRRTAIVFTSGTITNAYAIGYSCFGTTIAAGATCAFPVRFAPTSAGLNPGSLVLRAAVDTVTVNLSGTGVTPAARSVTPSTLAFDDHAPGSLRREF